MAEQLTLTEESFGLTIIDGESLQLTLDGGNGPSGPAGAAGATGVAGPNTITTSTTAPSLNGYIFGNGTTIAGATAAATAATANTLVLRDGSGNTSIGTATGSVTGNAGTVTSIGNLTGVVTSTNRATSIADAALSIAKTNGLQTVLDGKQAVAITRDTTEGRPIYSETITIADYPMVGGDEVLSFSGLLNGRPYYTSTGYGVYWDGAGLWVIYDNNAASEAWSSAEPVDTPQEVTSWNPEPASSGTPVVTGSAQTNPTASSVGQILRYGDSAPFEWYVAKGSGASTSWVLLVDNDSVNRAIEQGPAFSRFSLGITTIGDGLATAATESDARTTLGSGATGGQLFTAMSPAAARTTLELGATDSPTFGGLDLLTATTTTLNVYNSLSGANFERLSFRWASNIARIGTSKGGTGTARDLVLETDGTDRVRVLSTGNVGIGTTAPSSALQVGNIQSNPPNNIVTITGYDTFGMRWNAHNGWADYYFVTGFNKGLQIYNNGSNNTSNTLELGLAAAANARMLFQTNNNEFITVGTNAGGRTAKIGTLNPTNNFTGDVYIDTASAANVYKRFSFRNTGVFQSEAVQATSTTTASSFAGNVGIGTTSPASKLTVTGGDAEVTDATKGLILKTPDGTKRYRVTIDNAGALTTTLL